MLYQTREEQKSWAGAQGMKGMDYINSSEQTADKEVRWKQNVQFISLLANWAELGL